MAGNRQALQVIVKEKPPTSLSMLASTRSQTLGAVFEMSRCFVLFAASFFCSPDCALSGASYCPPDCDLACALFVLLIVLLLVLFWCPPDCALAGAFLCS